MDLRWWIVAIAGCVALAVGIGAAVLWPMDAGRRQLRHLANTARLTRLPQYRRAIRLRIVRLAVAAILLVTGFAAAVLAAARPTGLPSAVNGHSIRPAGDIMVCTGAPSTDPAVAAALQYFAEQVTDMGAERIGLTSANRRAIPLTRDYQYAAAQFADLARSGGSGRLIAGVTYTDYATSVEDVLAMCLTGFPDFGSPATSPRSLIYVGPATLGAPDDPRPHLFTADRLRDVATAARVQVNAVVTGPDIGTIDTLVRSTGGLSYPGGGAAAAQLAQIRAHPPEPGQAEEVEARTLESPDVPLVLGLLAVTGLLVWSRVVHL